MVWIVGGDFNCNGGSGIYMPTTYTHQAKHILDGFFADQYDTDFQVTASVAPYTYLRANGGRGQEAEVNTANIVTGPRKRGSRSRLPPRPSSTTRDAAARLC